MNTKIKKRTDGRASITEAPKILIEEFIRRKVELFTEKIKSEENMLKKSYSTY